MVEYRWDVTSRGTMIDIIYGVKACDALLRKVGITMPFCSLTFFLLTLHLIITSVTLVDELTRLRNGG